MFRRFQPFIPGFLQRLDKHLLLNHPHIWATRGHYVFFFGLLSLVAAFVMGATYQVDLANVPDPENRVWFALLPVAAGALLWVYAVSAYSGEKYPEHARNAPSMVIQAIYMGGILLLLAIPFVYGQQLMQQIKSAVSEQELAADIEAFIEGESFFATAPYELDELIEYGVITSSLWSYSEHHFSTDDRKKQLRRASRAQKAVWVESYKHVLSKYSGIDLRLSNENVLGLYDRRELVHWPNLEEIKHLAEENVMRIIRVQEGNTGFQRHSDISLFLYIALLLGMAMVVFVQVKSRDYIVGAVVAAAGLFAMAIFGRFVIEFLENLSGIGDNVWVLVIFISAYFLTLAIGFIPNRRPGYQMVASVSMILVGVTTPLLLLLFRIFLNEIHVLKHSWHWEQTYSFTWFLIATAACGWLAWNFFFRKRIENLNVNPKEQ